MDNIKNEREESLKKVIERLRLKWYGNMRRMEKNWFLEGCLIIWDQGSVIGVSFSNIVYIFIDFEGVIIFSPCQFNYNSLLNYLSAYSINLLKK